MNTKVVVSGFKWFEVVKWTGTFMFMGEYTHTIDAKGRIIIPSKYRDALGEHFVVTLGLDGCLFLYPEEEWSNFVTELKKLPGNKEGRKLQRYFMAGAADCEVDKQGRVLIPGKLRENAGLLKDIVFVGVLSKIEIWSKERFDGNSYEDVDEIAERMSEYGLSF